MGRTAAWVVPAAVLFILSAMFWPANLGGRTTYVATHGTSMLPRFHSGDLAIVQSTSEYRVGTIAAYKSETLHGTVVLHRIVAIDHGRFTFKGDNNDFTDPDHPAVGAIVGKLRTRVPRGGTFRAMLGRPFVLFPVILIVLFAAFAAPRKKRSRRGNAPSGHPNLGADSPRFVPAAVAMIGVLAIAGTVWLSPRTQTAKTARQYRQTARVGYSATTKAGAVYPDGHLRTGDPVFTRMVPPSASISALHSRHPPA